MQAPRQGVVSAWANGGILPTRTRRGVLLTRTSKSIALCISIMPTSWGQANVTSSGSHASSPGPGTHRVQSSSQCRVQAACPVSAGESPETRRKRLTTLQSNFMPVKSNSNQLGLVFCMSFLFHFSSKLLHCPFQSIVPWWMFLMYQLVLLHGFLCPLYRKCSFRGRPRDQKPTPHSMPEPSWLSVYVEWINEQAAKSTFLNSSPKLPQLCP